MNGKVMEAKDIGGVLWLRASDVSEEIARVRADTKTLRDYFAAKAMQAYINAHPGGSPDHRDAPDWVPTLAYEMADAMLSERGSL